MQTRAHFSVAQLTRGNENYVSGTFQEDASWKPVLTDSEGQIKAQTVEERADCLISTPSGF